MPDLTDKSQLIQFLKMEGLWAKKGLGQNFLIDREALEKIVEASELKEKELVIEIGPGPGVLTDELVKKTDQVVAVEMDDRLAELLQARMEKAGQEVKVIHNDILKVNIDAIVEKKPYKVIANIPYYITSKILELFLAREHRPELIVLLVQKEVAERICAKQGEMSVLAVSVQLFGQPELVGVVKPDSFFPAPKVDSAILRVRSNQGGPKLKDKEEEKRFFRTVHIGFAARRKTLANNLMVGFRLERNKVVDIIISMGFKETVRAQELSVNDWVKLAERIK